MFFCKHRMSILYDLYLLNVLLCFGTSTCARELWFWLNSSGNKRTTWFTSYRKYVQLYFYSGLMLTCIHLIVYCWVLALSSFPPRTKFALRSVLGSALEIDFVIVEWWKLSKHFHKPSRSMHVAFKVCYCSPRLILNSKIEYICTEW